MSVTRMHLSERKLIDTRQWQRCGLLGIGVIEWSQKEEKIFHQITATLFVRIAVAQGEEGLVVLIWLICQINYMPDSLLSG